MTRGQKTFLWLAVLGAVALFLFQPMGYAETYGRVRSTRWQPIWDTQGLTTDWRMMMLEYGILGLITAVGYFTNARRSE
jgi:hypothetical protein